MWNSFPTKVLGIIIAAPLLVVATFLLCCGSAAPLESQADKGAGTNSSLRRVALAVPTIWCSDCQLRVKASAKSVPGVKEVKFDNQTVNVSYDPEQTSPQAIVEAIQKGGDKVARVIEL